MTELSAERGNSICTENKWPKKISTLGLQEIGGKSLGKGMAVY